MCVRGFLFREVSSCCSSIFVDDIFAMSESGSNIVNNDRLKRHKSKRIYSKTNRVKASAKLKRLRGQPYQTLSGKTVSGETFKSMTECCGGKCFENLSEKLQV